MKTARVATERQMQVSCAPQWSLAGVSLMLVALATACVTPAEYRKLERRVIDMERQRGGADADGGRVAELGAQVDGLQRSVDEMNGRLEVTEHRVAEALEEARSARAEANQAAVTPKTGDEAAEGGEAAVESEEVLAYREAYGEWRAGDSQACIDRFTKFLQTYPSSEYADDATYWLADCYFKQGNFSSAVLRFDDVARKYPSGNKAADALYRQGEALLRMGHGKAAGNAFEKVLQDYPDSARAPEAKRQLDLLGSG
jgi:tol-pal system protein YbgF